METGLIHNRRDAVLVVCLTGVVGALSLRSALTGPSVPQQWLIPLGAFPLPVWTQITINLGFYLCVLLGSLGLYRRAQGMERVVVTGWLGVFALNLVQHAVPVSSVVAIRWIKAAGMVVAFICALLISLKSPPATAPISMVVQRRLLIFCAALITIVVLGALAYFIPR